MMTYLVEIASIQDSFWTLEKCRANSKEQAIIELKKVYGEDAIIGHIKATY